MAWPKGSFNNRLPFRLCRAGGCRVRSFLLNQQDGFIRRVGLLAGATALSQGLGVLVAPILTRTYRAEEFGLLAVYSTVLSAGMAISSLRYGFAIPLASDDRKAFRLLLLSSLLVVFLSLGIGGVSHLILRYSVASWRPEYSWLPLLGILFAGLFQVFNMWALRQSRLGEVAGAKVTQGAVIAVSQFGFGLIGGSAIGLIIGDVIGRATGAISLAVRSVRRDRPHFSLSDLLGIRRIAVEYWRFPAFSSPAALLNAIGSRIAPFLVSACYNLASAGYLALAMRVVGIPLSLIGTAVSQVYLSEGGKLVHTDPRKLQEIFHKTTRRLIIIGTPPFAVLMLLAPWVFRVAFGAEWERAGNFCQLLIPAFLLQFVVSPLSLTLTMLKRQGLQFLWDLFRVVSVSLAILLPANTGQSIEVALGCYSAASSLSYALLILCCRWSFKTHLLTVSSGTSD